MGGSSMDCSNSRMAGCHASVHRASVSAESRVNSRRSPRQAPRFVRLALALVFRLVLLTLVLVGCAFESDASGADREKRLTFDGLIKRDPVYTSDGRSILFAVRHKLPRLVLMKLDLETGQQTRLHPGAGLVELCPTLSRDKKWMAFLRMTGNDQCSVFIEDVDKKSVSQVKASMKVAWNAAISPNGQYAFYNLAGQLYRYDLTSQREQPAVKSAGRNDWPAVSPDSKQLAFVSSRDGNYELYVARIDGSNSRRLTNSAGMDVRPKWSANGRWLSFTSHRDGNAEVYVVGANGGEAHRVTRHPERDDYPTWHPSGKRIAFVAERDGKFDIYETVIDNLPAATRP